MLARDVVASIRRFAPCVIFANALVDATDELSAPDDPLPPRMRSGFVVDR